VPIPIAAYVNSQGGTIGPALAALREAPDFAVRAVDPSQLAESLRQELARGTSRVLVAGGDGTIAAAATVLAHSKTELAILPAGTLNHFARDHGVPTDPARALELARLGTARPVDVGWVNDRLFINTTSVGVYVTYVRARERLERYVGYRLASLIAAIEAMLRVKRFRVVVEAEGQARAYDTPLVFVGVGERSLGLPIPGARSRNSASGVLHILVPRPGTTIRALAGRYAFSRGGTRPVDMHHALADGLLTERCTIELYRVRERVALDGEVVVMEAPLEYRIERRALLVVLPRAAQAGNR
jgi:diacylglycerol kinase family enzyme